MIFVKHNVQFAKFRKLAKMIEMTSEIKTVGQLVTSLAEAKGWSKRVLAMVLGMSETVVNKITTDVRPITAADALLLEEIFGEPAERFLTLQAEYHLAKARIKTAPDPKMLKRATLFSELPIAEMAKRGWIDAPSVKDVSKVEREVSRFFGVEDPANISALRHAAKKTNVDDNMTSTQLAWLYRVRQIALEMVVQPATQSSVANAIRELKPLRVSEAAIRKVPAILAEAGIRFVIVESLPSAKIDGVCFWLADNAPVIGLTVRHDRIDNFWFVLRHELEHVIRGHGKESIKIDAELEGERAGTGPNVAEEERVANEEAADFCASARKIESFIARKQPFFSERDLIAFARLQNIHPGLAAGQLRYRTQRYELFSKHLVKVREHILPAAVVDGWGTVAPVGD